MLFHIVLRISKETPDWEKKKKKISLGFTTVNLICDALQQNREHIAQAYFEI